MAMFEFENDNEVINDSDRPLNNNGSSAGESEPVAVSSTSTVRSLNSGQVVYYVLAGIGILILFLAFIPGGTAEIADITILLVKIVATVVILYMGFIAVKQLKL